MKYIIDVDEDRLDSSGQLFIAVDIPNSQSAYEIPTGIWVKDYTEPDRKAIEDEVWEFAKKSELRGLTLIPKLKPNTNHGRSRRMRFVLEMR